MNIGVFCLVLGYVLSQFYRAFLAVLSPVLGAEIGTTPETLALSNGIWFLSFAVMQIPVGWALDKVGPRLTASALLALGGGAGALVFAFANGPSAVHLAMALIGIGCSPVLMASFYIFARQYSPAVFATLAGAVVGIGSFGNIAASLPLAWAADQWGWRGTSIALAVVTVIVALALFAFIQDPEKVERSETTKGSLLDILKMPAIWLVLPMALVNYAPAAGLRGTWAGPYFSQVHGLDASGIGQVTLFMGLAMIVGNLSYGPLDRVFGTRKWVVLCGNVAAAACLLGLALLPGSTLISAALFFALAGLFGSSFPMIMAHGRAFIPAHLAGRGVTLLNLFGIGGAGLIQFASGPLFRSYSISAGTPEQAYQTLFLTFAVFVLAGCAIYLFSQDRTD